jgi:hypothetical protein
VDNFRRNGHAFIRTNNLKVKKLNRTTRSKKQVCQDPCCLHVILRVTFILCRIPPPSLIVRIVADDLRILWTFPGTDGRAAGWPARAGPMRYNELHPPKETRAIPSFGGLLDDPEGSSVDSVGAESKPEYSDDLVNEKY